MFFVRQRPLMQSHSALENVIENLHWFVKDVPNIPNLYNPQ